MSITRMSFIELVAPRAWTEDLVVCIQDFGLLHMEEVPLVVEGSPGFLSRDQLTSEQETQREKLKEVQRIASELLPLFRSAAQPAESAVLEARRIITREDADHLLLHVSRLKRHAESLGRKQRNLSRDIESLGRYQACLSQATALGSQLEADYRHVALLVSREDQQAMKLLDQRVLAVDHARCRVIRHAGEFPQAHRDAVVVVAFPAEYEHAIHEIIRSSGLPRLRLPTDGLHLPLAKTFDNLNKRLRDLPPALKAVGEQIDAFRAQHHASMAAIADTSADILSRWNCLVKMAHSSLLMVLHAWMPTDAVPEFNKMIVARRGREFILTVRDQSAVNADVPVRLENSRPIRPFEQLLQLLSSPLYGTLDPTPFMAVGFPLFFGLILGDLGYGTMILILALLARRHWRRVPVAKSVTSVAVWCAASSMAFGVVFGECFGDLVARFGLLPLTVAGIRVMPIWSQREHVVKELLYGAIGFGFVHVVLGLVIGIVEAIRKRSRSHAQERMALLFGLLALVALVVPIPWPAAVAGPLKVTSAGALVTAVVLLLFSVGPVGAIEIISLVANILSYARLMALGVAAMVIANLANSMGAAHENPLIGIAVALPIHLLALTLGVLEPAVHSLRLHYVEFLPKFFAGDGRTFEPLRRKGTS